jgi:ABC-2 type transport system ATP-binding protein
VDVNAVEIRNITKRFGAVTAVDDLSLDVPAGSVYGFIGPNGSGKTTTLRMIMSIFYPDSGSIRVLGQEHHEAAMDRVGYLPEERGLYRKMKVRDVLRFYGRLKNGDNVSGDVDRWLERLDLADWADKRVEALSKGMSQKVQFIAAIAHRPELVILDEPFTGLDPVNLDVLQEAVLELRAAGSTVIFSTHDMSTAEAMCDFVFMIFQGQKVLDGTLADVQDRYGTDTVRVRIEGDATRLQGIPGVERITDRGQLQELRLQSGANSQEVLGAIMSSARVTHFELGRPSLHDIFVRIAGPEAEEASDA